MKDRYGIILLLAALAMATLAAVSVAGAEERKIKVKTFAHASDEGDGERQLRVEVEEENGKAQVKVYEMKDGEEVLIEEYETDDPSRVIELGDGKHCVIMAADGEGEACRVKVMDGHDGMHWIGKHGDGENVFAFKNGGTWNMHEGGAYLGIQMEDLSEQMADYFDAEGVLIKEVVEDSPADEAGFKAGDVIVRMGDDDIESTTDVTEFMSGHEADDEVEIRVSRKGDEKKIKVTLGEREGNAFAFFGGDDHFDVHAPHAPHGLETLHEHLGQLHGGDANVFMHRMDGGMHDELENLKADMEELKAMLEELKKDR